MRIARWMSAVTLLVASIHARAGDWHVWEGDFAGWGYQNDLDANGDLSFRLYVRPPAPGEGVDGSRPRVSIEIPATKVGELPITDIEIIDEQLSLKRVSKSGSEWEITLVRDGDQLKGDLRIGSDPVYRLMLHRSAVPLGSALCPDADALAGCYQTDAGDLIWITVNPWGELQYFYDDGALQGILFRDEAGGFFVGSAAYVPSAIEATVRFEPASDGVMTTVWTRPGQTPRSARRIELRSEEFVVDGPSGQLAGTLICPPGDGPFTTAVVLGGSEWRVRAGCMADARALLSVGLAVAIFDARGCGKSTGERLCRFVDSADDAGAILKTLTARADVRKVGLYGRSRGGWTAPLAASRHTQAGFVIMVSGAFIPPFATETNRRLNTMRAQGYGETAVSQADAYLKLLWDADQSEASWTTYLAARERIIDLGWQRYLGGPTDRASEFYRWQVMNYPYDPEPAIRALHCPLLAVFGEGDMNISPQPNIASLWATFDGNIPPNIVTKVIPGADHGMRAFDMQQERRARLHLIKGFVPEYPRELRAWLEQTGLLGAAATTPVQHH